MARIVSTAGRSCHDESTETAIRSPRAGACPPRSQEELEEQYDNPLERLQLLGGNDDAIAAFLDEIDVRGPRDREMLRELARHVAAREARALRSRSPARRSSRSRAFAATATTARTRDEDLGPLRTPVRFLVELVARYVVVSHVKNVAMNLRNLYWLREMQAEPGSPEVALLRKARFDAQALVDITKSREIGVPTFVIGGLLIPAGLSLWRLASGTTREWWIALLVGAIGVAVGLLDLLVRPPRRRAGEPADPPLGLRPLAELWRTLGSCGLPPKDQSRRFAIVAISLTLGVWIVLPLLVTLSLRR